MCYFFFHYYFILAVISPSYFGERILRDQEILDELLVRGFSLVNTFQSKTIRVMRVVETKSHVVAVQPLSHVQLFVIPWTAAHQTFLSFTIFQSLLKLMSIESVMPSNHLILCRPLLLLPSVFPSIRVFSN